MRSGRVEKTVGIGYNIRVGTVGPCGVRWRMRRWNQRTVVTVTPKRLSTGDAASQFFVGSVRGSLSNFFVNGVVAVTLSTKKRNKS